MAPHAPCGLPSMTHWTRGVHGSKFPELSLNMVIQQRTVGETCFIHLTLAATAKLKSLLRRPSCERVVLGWV